jgi:UDP:flavonoid glycosyltransferase YjiC (YdhE family)
VTARLLVATLDGAGNLQPILALVDALVRQRYDVHVIAHDVQQEQIESAGGVFIRYETAPQFDQSVRGYLGADPAERTRQFIRNSSDDALAVAEGMKPNLVLVDCMLPRTLRVLGRKGYKTVALVHGIYSFWIGFNGGGFRAPIDDSMLALGFSYAAFDQGAPFPANFVFVGPARPEGGAPAWRRRWPGKRFVVASLSTGIQSAGQLDLLQRICDALAGMDVEALVTTGRGIAPESLFVGAKTTVERRVPHDAVLPRADLLITHGGHGTVMAGLRYGVPMLCLPPIADQPVNAAKVAELGLGLAMAPTSPSADIRAAIQYLLDDHALRERSRAFAAEVAHEPGLERAIALIEALAS